jgi:phage tail-like protein
MPGPNPTNNYIGGFHFRVTIQGINDPLDGFTSCSGVVSETEPMQFKHGMDVVVRKAPGRTVFQPITLERVYSGIDEFTRWRDSIIAGNIDRRTVSVEYLRSDQSLVTRYDLLGAWISKWESPPLDAMGSNGAMEKVELTYEMVIQG